MTREADRRLTCGDFGIAMHSALGRTPKRLDPSGKFIRDCNDVLGLEEDLIVRLEVRHDFALACVARGGNGVVVHDVVAEVPQIAKQIAVAVVSSGLKLLSVDFFPLE